MRKAGIGGERIAWCAPLRRRKPAIDHATPILLESHFTRSLLRKTTVRLVKGHCRERVTRGAVSKTRLLRPAIANEKPAFVVWLGAEIYFGIGQVDLAIPLVWLAGLRMDKRDFVLEPEQGPRAPIFACGNLPQVVRATDLQDKRARHTMALEKSLSNVVQVLRTSVG